MGGPVGKIVHTAKVRGEHPVCLYQCKQREGSLDWMYRVTYGPLVDERELRYAQAAKRFGECVMHALGCAGKLKPPLGLRYDYNA